MDSIATTPSACKARDSGLTLPKREIPTCTLELSQAEIGWEGPLVISYEFGVDGKAARVISISNWHSRYEPKSTRAIVLADCINADAFDDLKDLALTSLRKYGQPLFSLPGSPESLFAQHFSRPSLQPQVYPCSLRVGFRLAVDSKELGKALLGGSKGAKSAFRKARIPPSPPIFSKADLESLPGFVDNDKTYSIHSIVVEVQSDYCKHAALPNGATPLVVTFEREVPIAPPLSRAKELLDDSGSGPALLWLDPQSNSGLAVPQGRIRIPEGFLPHHEHRRRERESLRLTQEYVALGFSLSLDNEGCRDIWLSGASLIRDDRTSSFEQGEFIPTYEGLFRARALGISPREILDLGWLEPLSKLGFPLDKGGEFNCIRNASSVAIPLARPTDDQFATEYFAPIRGLRSISEREWPAFIEYWRAKAISEIREVVFEPALPDDEIAAPSPTDDEIGHVTGPDQHVGEIYDGPHGTAVACGNRIIFEVEKDGHSLWFVDSPSYGVALWAFGSRADADLYASGPTGGREAKGRQLFRVFHSDGWRQRLIKKAAALSTSVLEDSEKK